MTTARTFILEEELIQYWYNLIQFLSNLPKIISSQKTVDIIFQMRESLVFCIKEKNKKKKKKKLIKIVKIEEMKIHTFEETWWILMKFSGKM